MKKTLGLILGLIAIDQLIKIWVKTSMRIGEGFPLLGNALEIYFIENNGMAWGMEFGGEGGKIALTLFRLLAVGGIFYLLYDMLKKGPLNLMSVGLAMVFAGALGNIIDSVFYGQLFSESNRFFVAETFPETGYAPWLQGKVVDMFFFNIRWPESMGGSLIFPPIWNFADACISIGVACMLLFSFFKRKASAPETKPTS
jgi:signal peptidase II